MDPSYCKPEDVSLWHRHIAEKPFRVLDVFRIPRGSNEPNKWGDTRKAMFPAMRALTEATEAPMNLNSRYRRVFAEGIAELLCNQVVESAHPSDGPSGTYIEFDEETHNQYSAIYYYLIGILCNALCTMTDTENAPKRDQGYRLLVQSLEKNWIRMAKAISDAEKAQPVDPEDYDSITGRMAFSTMVTVLCREEVYFYRIFDECDHTMRLLTRALLAFSDAIITEFMITNEAFCVLLIPDSPKAASYRETTPAPANMLDRIIEGADGSFETILTKFAWFLDWLELDYCESCVLVLRRLREFTNSHKLPLHQECHSKLLESEEVWRGVFRVWRLGASQLDVYDIGGKNAGDGLCSQVILYLLGAIIASVKSSGGTENQGLPVARVIPLLQADVLGTLDEILPKLAARRETLLGLSAVDRISEHMAFILDILLLSIQNDADLASITRPHLPRPRIFRALLEAVYVRNGHFISQTWHPPSSKKELDEARTNRS